MPIFVNAFSTIIMRLTSLSSIYLSVVLILVRISLLWFSLCWFMYNWVPSMFSKGLLLLASKRILGLWILARLMISNILARSISWCTDHLLMIRAHYWFCCWCMAGCTLVVYICASVILYSWFVKVKVESDRISNYKWINLIS